MPIRREYRPVAGRCPYGTGLRDFFVNVEDLERIRQEGPTWKFYDARLIAQTLRYPDAIFRGLKRKDFEESFCYAKAPRFRYIPGCKAPMKAPPPEGMVFLVFVRPEKGLVVFDWEWRPEHEDLPGHPADWKRNFERRIWLRR